MKKMFSRIACFLKTDIWEMGLHNVSSSRLFVLRTLKIIFLVFREFRKDYCMLQASALTFYSILAIVPILAMAFGVARGFNFDILLEKELLERFRGHQEIISNAIILARNALTVTQSGIIAGVGVVVLMWTVIKVLQHIEHSFNRIWGVDVKSNWFQKFSKYFSISFICLILLVISSSVTIIIAGELDVLISKIPFVGKESMLFQVLINLLPCVVVLVMMMFAYIVIPNTKVRFTSALVASLIAGSIYQLFQWAYVYFQIGISQYSVVYGSFAALPLFLIWLQISWAIILLGAEIAFAHQNIHEYEGKRFYNDISWYHRKILAIMITQRVVKNFMAGVPGRTAIEIADALKMPIALIRRILQELVQCSILSEVVVSNTIGYQPARNVNMLTLYSVIDFLERNGNGSTFYSEELIAMDEIVQSLKNIGTLVENSPENKILHEI